MGMNWSGESVEDALDRLSLAISEEVARAMEVLGDGADVASSVHEARRAIKRSRALLRLADPWPASSSIECALRDASRAIAELRDADVVTLTAEGIRESGGPAGRNIVPTYLIDRLTAERDRRFGESGSAEGPLRMANELLGSIAVNIGALASVVPSAGHEPTPSDGRALLRHGLRASYGSARAGSDRINGEEQTDGRSHKLRKRVKDLRYQLEFLDPGQPDLGRLVSDLHRLSDLLGDRNDLATLSTHTASIDGLDESQRTALAVHVEGLKRTLGEEAETLGARLFEEEPDSFVARVEAWVAPGQG